MKPLNFNKTLFIKSAMLPEQYPTLHKGKDKVPEVAFVGRSNVGKSSLINHLTEKKGLAKTSSVPGKTQTLNFYLVDNKLCLVDLPGYGFSEVAGSIKKTWADSLETYLEQRSQLRCIFVLIDLRRELALEDKGFITWAISQKRPLYYVFTKEDKLSSAEAAASTQLLIQQIQLLDEKASSHSLTYSIKNIDCRNKLKTIMQELANSEPLCL